MAIAATRLATGHIFPVLTGLATPQLWQAPWWWRTSQGLVCLTLAWGAAVFSASALAQTGNSTAPAASCPPEAQPISPDKARAMAGQAQDRGMLWRVEHKGRSAWLYGTIHVGRAAWVFPGPTVLKALRQADSVGLELNLLDPAQMKALAEGMRANPQAAPLPAELTTALAREHAQACNNPAQMKALRPEAQLMTVLMQNARRQGLDPAYGIDMSLAGVAQSLQKQVFALETPELQLRALLSDDPAKIERDVRTGLAQLDSGSLPQQLSQLTQAWASGDVAKLSRYAEWCNCMETPQERADFVRLVEGRNPRMAREMAERLRTGTFPFVAVGALHMVGPKGLPALLQAEGFRVQRVPLNAVSNKSDPKPASTQ